MMKKRFLAHMRSKLQPRGDGLFQVLEQISDNTYKVDLSCGYDVSATFNVYDLSLFDVGEYLRSDPLRRGNNENHQASSNDPLEILIWLIIRKIKKALDELIQNI
jgi:hypothetical protein